MRNPGQTVWRKRIATAPHTRALTPADKATEGTVLLNGRRLSDGLFCLATFRLGSSLANSDTPDRCGVQSPELGAQGDATRRGGNRQVEARSTVIFHKTHNVWVHIWCFSTCPACCPFPASSGSGYTESTLPPWIALVRSTEFRLLVLWISLRQIGEWSSSPHWEFEFPRICSISLAKLSYLFGIGRQFLLRKKLSPLSHEIQNFRQRTSLPMCKNSTYVNMPEKRPIEPSWMPAPETCPSYPASSTVPYAG